MSESSQDKILCSIYRSPKKEGMYIYVPKKEGFEQVYSLEGGFRAWVQAGLPTVKTNSNT